MIPVPWRHINSWQCNGCGVCCKNYQVVLKFNEWLRLINRFGPGVTSTSLNRFYLGKRPDGSCIFLWRSGNIHLCALQGMKPVACKLWPFRVLSSPKYGRRSEALFEYKGNDFYVYIDPSCPQIVWGEPSLKLVNYVIPEFIEIALGVREMQYYSTSQILIGQHLKTRLNGRFI